MNFKKALPLLALPVVLAACQQEVDKSSAGFLGQAYVTDWSVYEGAAAWLRNQTTFTNQKITWTPFPDVTITSNSLTHSRVDYAQAAGLTGAGQVISIVDAGFLVSHDALSGKTIHTVGGANLPVASHGTTVASVAAGTGSDGEMIGVAPDANLQLGVFTDFTAMTDANTQAKALGAIVQNNSWGYTWPDDGTPVTATAENYNRIFDSPSGGAYLASIKSLARDAIIVFAASNDENLTRSDITSALPIFEPTLEDSWITVVNATPVLSDGKVASATLLSSACLQAAPWCMAADGTVWAAVANDANPQDNSSYSYGTGSSFAAPQVSGAIALLAEAFPDMSAQQLRARLLASADNSFFTPTGFVEFAPGVKHGYNDIYGNGFLDLKAALSPIGSAYLPQSNGTYTNIDSPVLASGGMAGDAVASQLSRYELKITDAMGGQFDRPASILSAQTVISHDPLAAIQGMFATGLDPDAIGAFQENPTFARFSSGQEVTFEVEDTRLAMLLPADGSAGDSYGLSIARAIDTDAGRLYLGLTSMREGDGFVGLRALTPYASLSGRHTAATMDWDIPLGNQQVLNISGSLGVASPIETMTDVDLSPALYNSFSMTYGAQDVFGKGDRIAFGIGLPQAVQSGGAQITVPVSAPDRSGAVSFETLDIALAPAQREVDLSVSYGFELQKGSDIVLRGVRRLNDGNIAGANTSEAAIAFRFEF